MGQFGLRSGLRVIYGALKKGGRRVRAEVSRAEANGFRYVPSCEERRHQKRSRNENLWRYSV
jgi:hypothetical protein